MSTRSAVLVISQEEGRAVPGPLMLQDMLFCPVARWLAASLSEAGVERFFVIGDAETLGGAAGCLPEGAECAARDDAELDEKLAAFAEGAEGKIITITRPVWLSFAAARELSETEFLPPAEGDLGVYRVDPEALMQGGARALTAGEGYAPDPEDGAAALPIRGLADLARAQHFARYDVLGRLISRGVRVLDPDTVYVDPTVSVGFGTALLPGTILRGETVIGENCEIGPNTMIRDCTLGDGCVANSSQLNESVFGAGCNIGPFAYVRPGSRIADRVKVGDFVEIKNANLGEGTKIPHLIYVGDADVGQRCNFGCGSITCNYDGNAKYRTTVGDDCFISCNTNLVAPCTVESGAFTAAGTTITDTVPANSLAIGRVRAVIKENWAAEHRARKK